MSDDGGYSSGEDHLDDMQVDYGEDRVIIVDNLPVVDPAKKEKLISVLNKLYSQIGAVAKDGITMPLDPATNMSKGFAFVEFETAKAAAKAQEQTNGHRLDRSHIFKVNLLSEFDKFMEVGEQFVEPEVPPYTEPEDTRAWLLDPRSREQFLSRHGEESEIFWHENGTKPVSEYCRKKWTDTGHVFSPQGSYVATFHRPGIGLWGGPTWARMNRFPHQCVKFIDFSPQERYLVTMSDRSEQGRPSTEESVIIWDIASGKAAREFKIEAPKQAQSNWPHFKWSHDDKYFARLADDAIQVYETPSMGLLDKKSLKIPGAKDFCWSPTDPILCVFTPEAGENPAKVYLIEMPSRKELRQKNLYNVNDVKMHWQSNGDYLCVKVDRHSKSKKTVYTNFELFRLRVRDVPIEVLEIKDQIIAFAWEPKGHRFTICHGDPPRVDVSFYTMRPPMEKGVVESHKIKLLKTLEKRPVNHIFWAPTGNLVLLAGLKTLNGVLHFYNVNDLELMSEEEHFMCTDVEWDPSGRFVASSVSAWRQPLENGYCIWSFCGKLLCRTAVDKFYQFIWRPRPKSLLSAKKEKEIRKNIATYAKRYQIEDEQRDAVAASAKQDERKHLRDQFRAAEAARKQLFAQQKAARMALRGGYDSEDESVFEMVEDTIHEIVSVKEEVVSGAK